MDQENCLSPSIYSPESDDISPNVSGLDGSLVWAELPGHTSAVLGSDVEALEILESSLAPSAPGSVGFSLPAVPPGHLDIPVQETSMELWDSPHGVLKGSETRDSSLNGVAAGGKKKRKSVEDPEKRKARLRKYRSSQKEIKERLTEELKIRREEVKHLKRDLKFCQAELLIKDEELSKQAACPQCKWSLQREREMNRGSNPLPDFLRDHLQAHSSILTAGDPSDQCPVD